MNLLYCQRGMLCPHFFSIGLLWLLCHGSPVAAQESFTVQGTVVSEKGGEPLPGASVHLRGTQQGTTTNEQGMFTFSVPGNRVELSISFIGYIPADTLLRLPLTKELTISLREDAARLREVAVTGYQHIPAERATGSFVSVNNQLLNRRVSTNVLERLNGVANGVYFSGLAVNPSTANPLGRNLNIRIRGESTLAEATQVSRDPLIVLDNFPFEGNLNNINPNDIESITILKDAAAASIWGARAGNGVIVITTKKGIRNSPLQVEINSNTTITGRPDFSHYRNILPSEAYIGVERLLFEAGYFNSDLNNRTSRPPLSPVVELLARQRSGELSAQQADEAIRTLSNHDIRDDYRRYIYRQGLNQQYSIDLKGGASNAAYRVSAGYDHNRTNQVRNDFRRFTLNTGGTYSVTPKLELSLDLGLTSTLQRNPNDFSLSGFLVGGKSQKVYPYAKLADENGHPLIVTRGHRVSYLEGMAGTGLLDWYYRPLDELKHADQSNRNQMFLIKTGADYKILKGLVLSVKYQNEHHHSRVRRYYDLNTYYTRNIINQFSNIDSETGKVSYQLPKGEILELDNIYWRSHNARGQLNYNLDLKDWSVSSIAGAEIRALRTESMRTRFYGYKEDLGIAVANVDHSTRFSTLPSGSATIPNPGGTGLTGFINRFISYYANGALTYRNRYTLTLSGRKDGSNIFGANTNNRLTPLWSTGLLWDLGKEDFYSLSQLPRLKFRASFGYSGNVYQGAVYTTGVFTTSDYSGETSILNLTAPNPDLRWEKIRNLNLALDFGTRNEIISGSIEFFRKSGLDLIQNEPLAPSKGFSFFYTNSAATLTKGIDITLRSRNLTRSVKWNTTLLFSTVRDEIVKFSQTQTASSIRSPNGRPGLVGKPLYSIYSYRWAGLDPENGDPKGYLNGAESTDYLGIMNNFNPDSLVYHGSARPAMFGSLRNDVSWKNLTLSVNITGKFSYYFRRPSTTLNYQEILAGMGHSDFLRRWQARGDELTTNVPSLTYPANSNRSIFYEYSEALVEKADHIRLQDIRLDYDFRLKSSGLSRIQTLAVYAYLNNAGILWRANKHAIDPDYVASTVNFILPAPLSLSLGARVVFK